MLHLTDRLSPYSILVLLVVYSCFIAPAREGFRILLGFDTRGLIPTIYCSSPISYIGVRIIFADDRTCRSYFLFMVRDLVMSPNAMYVTKRVDNVVPSLLIQS